MAARQRILKDAEVVCATCIGVGSDQLKSLSFPCGRWWKAPSALPGHSTRPASLDHPKALAAPSDRAAHPEQRGSGPWPPPLGAACVSAEDFSLCAAARCVLVDEATQATEASALVAFCRGARQVGGSNLTGAQWRVRRREEAEEIDGGDEERQALLATTRCSG